jgi:hypothetical protein
MSKGVPSVLPTTWKTNPECSSSKTTTCSGRCSSRFSATSHFDVDTAVSAEDRPEANTFIIAVRDPNKEITADLSIVSAVLNKPLEINTLADVVRECAFVVPPPEDQHGCPLAESDVRASFDRRPMLAN